MTIANNEKATVNEKALRETQTLRADCAYRRRLSSISVPNLKRIAQLVHKLLNGSQSWVMSRCPRPLRGRFIVPTHGGSDLQVCPKFAADSSFRSKVIMGVSNFESGSRDPGHTNFGVVLYSIRRRGLSSTSVSNLKQIAQFV